MVLRAISLFSPKPSFVEVNWQTDTTTNKPHGAIDFLLLSSKKDNLRATGFVIVEEKQLICYTGNSVKTCGSFSNKASDQQVTSCAKSYSTVIMIKGNNALLLFVTI